jgi:MYXO-CTERM domain-containing protein
MRSDITHAAMTTDFILQAAPDQSELTNVRNVTQAVNLTCPVYNGCNVVGQAPYGPQADGGVGTGAAPGSSDSSGCATTAQPTNLPNLGLAALSALGVAVLIRSRKRRSR